MTPASSAQGSALFYSFPMWYDSDLFRIPLICITVVVAVVMTVDFVRQLLRHRARSMRYQELNTQPMRLSRPVDLGDSIPTDVNEAIRIDAQNAACLAALRPGHAPTNPYRAGSPEGIIWFATFNLVATQLSEVDIDLSEPVDNPIHPGFTDADLHFWSYTTTQPG